VYIRDKKLSFFTPQFQGQPSGVKLSAPIYPNGLLLQAPFSNCIFGLIIQDMLINIVLKFLLSKEIL